MKTGQRHIKDYTWDDAREQLADGVHPEVVAARLGEHVSYILEVSDAQAWPITWKGPDADQILDSFRMDA